MRRRVWLSLIVLNGVVFILSSGLFALQGGFGGGHGRFDIALYCMSLPWLWLFPDAIWSAGDYLPVALCPFLLNLTVLLIMRFVLQTLASRIQTDPLPRSGVDRDSSLRSE